MEHQYYRCLSRRKRVRVWTKVAGDYALARVISCWVSANYYTSARWERKTLQWELDKPESREDFSTFISSLTICGRQEYLAAHAEYLRFLRAK